MRRDFAVALLLLLMFAGCAGKHQHPTTTAPAPVRRLLPLRLPPGFSLVAAARGRRISIYARPGGRRFAVLHSPNPQGAGVTFLVRSQRPPDWLRVYLPLRPNGSSGWVRLADVALSADPYRIDVSLGAHRLTAWRLRRRLLSVPVALGTPSTPTPPGLYFVTSLVRVVPADGVYGPYALGLSAHSPTLATFNGADAQIAIHGTDRPASVGGDSSNGCIVLANASVQRLAARLPLATPVRISP